MNFPQPLLPVEAGCLAEGLKVLCPVCRYSYVHIERVSYAPGEHCPVGVEVTSQAVRWNREVPCEGRGDRVFIEFWGECGHRFGLLLQHHKGETFIHRLDS